MGLNLSFSVRQATWKSALFIIMFATAGFLAPAAYLAWWGLFGGRERETQQSIEQLIQKDPVREATSAIRKEDYRLYSTGGPMDAYAPGIGAVSIPYKDTFGYRGFTLLEGDPLSYEQARLNNAAVRYMTEYNQVVYPEVNRLHPHWLQQYRQKHPDYFER